MNDWIADLRRALEREPAIVRIAVASIKGSAPREPGASMLVGTTVCEGSIGGGHLEFKAIEIARHMLQQTPGATARLDRFALGATLGQCCGGAVNLWFDRFEPADLPFLDATLAARASGPAVIATELRREGPARRTLYRPVDAAPPSGQEPASAEVRSAVDALLRADADHPGAILLQSKADASPVLLECAHSRHPRLWLFGAGHVGRALVGVFADLPFEIVWVDSRPDAFPHQVPANVARKLSDSPVEEVECAPPGAWYLVMTHSHDLDYDLCAAILRRNDHAWAGLIGSETKATCFSVRFARDGIAPQAVARLTSPIGTTAIRSKLPGAIAVSVAAQLLEVLEARQADLHAPKQRPERVGASRP